MQMAWNTIYLPLSQLLHTNLDPKCVGLCFWDFSLGIYCQKKRVVTKWSIKECISSFPSHHKHQHEVQRLS